MDALAAIFSISLALALVIVWRESQHQHRVAELKKEITTLRAQVVGLQGVILRHFPSERASLNINGNVNDSVIATAGRDIG